MNKQFIKCEKIRIKCDIKVIKTDISFIKYELKHNKKLTYEQKKSYIIKLNEKINRLYYKRWCLICL